MLLYNLESFAEYCSSSEQADVLISVRDKDFYNALSVSFVISRKASDDTYYIDIRKDFGETQTNTDEYVVEESPLTPAFDDNENRVGACSVNIRRIEIVL